MPSNTNNSGPFILVFRPYQRRAWAEVFLTERAFLDAWLRGNYNRCCHALAWEEESRPTFDDAIDAVVHDLSSLTLLRSAEECLQYIEDREYGGRHNKGLSQVMIAAEKLDWLPANEPAPATDHDE